MGVEIPSAKEGINLDYRKMGDDSAADDREVERQLKAGLKSGSI